MNSCVLMAQVMSEPELRYTQDNTPLAQMLIEFPALRDGDAPCRIKAVGWGKIGTEIQESYHEGDQVILVGRLSMNTIDRPEGFKEKKAEFVISQIQAAGEAIAMSSAPAMSTAPAPVAAPSNVVPLKNSYQAPEPTPSYESQPSAPEPNLDDIPF
ncbi:MAG: single-stranded DNA-binding protein [Limnothrix sp.]